MKCSWQEGNRIRLLENGDNYYPALFAAIGRAQQRVILESFIWFEDDVGKQLHAVLLKAAQRGVRVEVLLDGYGSPDLSGKLCGRADVGWRDFSLLRSAPAPARHAHQFISPYASQNRGD